MTVIGITGPTGAGKTTALEILESLGFEIVDCDALYYQLLQTDGALRRSLTDAFGQVFLPDGRLDRKAVAKRVFSDPAELAKLNAIVFPAVSAAVKQKIKKCSQKGVAIDAINLVESGMGRMCDATVAVTAPPAIRLRRIMARDGLTQEQAQARIAAQKPDGYYKGLCTYLLENQEEDKEVFQGLMRDFFANLLEFLNGGNANHGCEGMERETADAKEKRL
ncbi:MAG: dephospho-CoA kinase [Oscillospiraceae bacterium]|jgi:dephospho-CoA kinase|nr:dephospho-CoA kinase [Oscillospiraceae bacterium]MDE6998286.1 dephospho-CoA kinase [Oscillospiraceae bacterium]